MNKRGKIKKGVVTIFILILVILILKAESVVPQPSDENNLLINQTINKNVEFNMDKVEMDVIGLIGEKKFDEIIKEQQERSAQQKLLDEVISRNNKQYIDPTILEQFHNNSEVSIIVDVIDTSNISISAEDSIEEQTIKDLKRKELFEDKIASILSNLSDSEFKLKGKFITGRGFYGTVTKEGFEKLVRNPNVAEIYLDSISYVADSENESNYTAEYDPEILNAFENQTWVRVIVRLVDNSGINITGTKEERRVLSRQRDEWFKPVIDEVLASLSEAELKEPRKHISEFSSEISKEGFDKLVKNPTIKEIVKTLETGAHITDNDSISENISKVEKEHESEREMVEIKEKSWFQRIIQFFKSLFK